MAKRSSKKPPTDINQLAKYIVDQTTGDAFDEFQTLLSPHRRSHGEARSLLMVAA